MVVVSNFLKKYRLLRILSMTEAYFYTETVPSDFKINKTLIALNYSKKSPFANATILSYKSQDKLYIWFVKKIQSKAILIPEAYIYYKILHHIGDNIYIVEGEKFKKIFIIKNSMLHAAFMSSDENDAILKLAEAEYSIKGSYVINIQESKRLYKESLEKLTLSDILPFVNIELKKENLQKNLLEKLTYPLVTLIVTYIFVTYTQAHYMQKENEELLNYYQSIKKENKEKKETIKRYNNQIIFYKSFIKNEIHHADLLQLLPSVYTIIDKNSGAQILNLNLVGNTLRITLKTKKSSVVYINKLNNLNLFERVVVQNSVQRKDNYKIYTYEMQLKGIQYE